MIYNGSYIEDVSNILAFIDGFSEKYNLNIGGTTQMGVNVIKLEAVARVINDLDSFPHNDGAEKASAFKKIAHFIVWFVSERPIINPFKTDKLPEDLLKIENHQNAIVALLVGLRALHESSITQDDGSKLILSNPLELSSHSFTDIVDAVSRATPSTGFQLVSVLLEQIAYKTNSTCQYNPVKF